MSCYHPLIGIQTGELTKNGKQKLRIVGLDKNDSIEKIKRNEGILIPCGKCIGCRLDYSRKWADRMMLELETQKKAIFVTLTYDNDHVHWSQFYDNDEPMFATLEKKDCQLFMKSLRQHCIRDLGIEKIRFFLAGEYGEHTLRPHYHAIIYGIGLSDIMDCKLFSWNTLGQPFYSSEWLKKIWTHGNVLLSDVSWKTCAYVARYVTKKMTGEMAKSYAERNVIPEFSLMSRKPGLGSDYLKLHTDCLDFSSINLMTPDGSQKIQIPQYYLRKLELIDKEKYDKIKNERKRFANDKMLLELSKTDLGLAEYLEQKEYKRKQKVKVLKRKDGCI